MKFSKELQFTSLNQSVGSDSLRAEPLALSPRSSGTNTRMSLNAHSREVPGLRTFPSQAVTSARPVIGALSMDAAASRYQRKIKGAGIQDTSKQFAGTGRRYWQRVLAYEFLP